MKSSSTLSEVIGSRHDIKVYKNHRICKCGTILSKYNPDKRCFSCQKKCEKNGR